MKRLIVTTEMEKVLNNIRFEHFRKHKKNIPYTEAQKELIRKIKKNAKKII